MLKFVLDLHCMNLNEHHDVVVGTLSYWKIARFEPRCGDRFSLQICYMFLLSVDTGIGISRNIPLQPL
jgi:hypothetical protein